MILLPSRPSDSLNWNLNEIPPEQTLLWRFDLGLENPFFPIDDRLHFQALTLALSKFSQEVWPKFQDRTQGAVLYQGSIDFCAQFAWTEKQKENFEIWKEDRPDSEDVHLQRLFCADAFAHYFQLLAHSLPDELPLYLLLDGSNVGSLSERHQLFSKERFEHFLVASKGLPFTNGMIWDGNSIHPPLNTSSSAICFPQEIVCSKHVLQRLEHKMACMQKPFRVIEETFLTESWEGVDILHVLPDTLSPQGERKLLGFQAAGGRVVRENIPIR